MARKVQIVLEDDLDGSAAEETVSFALDGVGYEIDLSAANAAGLRDAFAPYVGAARKAGRGGGAKPRGRSRAKADGPAPGSPSEIRAWAKAQGLDVSERGRIPAEVVAKFEAAQA
ncbi:MAG: Lsr2 family protein [Candidatus Nanopelagicales bacterium]